MKNVYFRLRRGAATCIVGETGAGKSLVAEALLGLLAPGLRAEGSVVLPDGRRFDLSNPSRLHGLWGAELFLLPQEPREALDATACLLGQVAEAVQGPGRRSMALRLLARFGLGEAVARSVPAALSGGMAQRGMMAIAAAVPAPVMVADEPTKGLDPARVNGVVRSLLGMQDSGRSLLVVTHDLGLPAALGADLLVLHDGAVVELGLAAEVLSSPGHAWTRTLVAATPSSWPSRRRVVGASPPLIEAAGVSFAWPGKPALFDDVSLRVRAGSILGVTGASGAGKSTLCDLLLGLRRPSAGAVTWDAGDPARMRRKHLAAERRRFQKLYQDPGASFPPHRRLRAVFADLAAVTDTPLLRLEPLMERLGLRPDTLDRKVGDISGGEAQRLALARTLLLRPAILLADEPTSRLDALTQAGIARLLRELADREGLAVVWISHDADLLGAMADEVAVLSHRDAAYCPAKCGVLARHAPTEIRPDGHAT